MSILMYLWYLFCIWLTGFTACAEFGSFAFVHPVIKKLPPKYRIEVEQGLVKTFGSFMPFAMTASMAVSIMFAIQVLYEQRLVSSLAIAAAICFTLAIIFTVIFNVPRNYSVVKWDSEQPPENWERQRTIWEVFQGVRATLQLFGFVLFSAAVFLMAGMY